jgi:hypothetical protein
MGRGMPRDHRPAGSFVDKENRRQQAATYHVFNNQSFLSRYLVKPSSEKGEVTRYKLDRFTEVLIKATEPQEPGELLLEKRTIRSFWGSLIYCSDADPEHVKVYVTEHRYGASHPDEAEIIEYEDAETEVLPDEEVAEILGWPLEKVRLGFDEDAIRNEVKEKYEENYYGYGQNRLLWPFRDLEWSGPYESWKNRSVFSWRPFSCSSTAGLQRGRPISIPRKAEDFYYLTSFSKLDEVADALREASALLSGEKMDPEKCRYLVPKASLSQVLDVLVECCALIMRNRSSIKQD